MPTRSSGFQLEAVGGPDPCLRIHVPPDRHSPESVELRLKGLPGDMAAVTGHVTVTGRRPGAERLSETAGQAVAATTFRHETALLIQQVRNGDAKARLRLGLRSDVTSFRLQQVARAMFEDMSTGLDAQDKAPLRTKGRLPRFAALLATDRMLSRPHGISHRPGGAADGCIRTCVPAERHLPERFQLRLLSVPEADWRDRRSAEGSRRRSASAGSIRADHLADGRQRTWDRRQGEGGQAFADATERTLHGFAREQVDFLQELIARRAAQGFDRPTRMWLIGGLVAVAGVIRAAIAELAKGRAELAKGQARIEAILEERLPRAR